MLLATRLRSLCPGLFLLVVRIVLGEVSVLSCAELLSRLFLGIHRGRFGQVHKCTEISTGLNLAAKIIKVKGAKEKVTTLLGALTLPSLPAQHHCPELPHNGQLILGYHQILQNRGLGVTLHHLLYS